MATEMADRRQRPSPVVIVTLVAVAALAVFVLVILGTHPDIIDSAICTPGNGVTCKAGSLSPFINAAKTVDGPATVAIGSVSTLGVITGSAMLGIAHPSATRVLATSAGAGFVVLLAKGLVL